MKLHRKESKLKKSCLLSSFSCETLFLFFFSLEASACVCRGSLGIEGMMIDSPLLLFLFFSLFSFDSFLKSGTLSLGKTRGLAAVCHVGSSTIDASLLLLSLVVSKNYRSLVLVTYTYIVVIRSMPTDYASLSIYLFIYL